MAKKESVNTIVDYEELFKKEEKGKEIVVPGEKVVLNLKSNGKYVVTVTRDSISILTKGFMNTVNKGITGEKRFFFRNMSGVQYKDPGFTTGYLQFILIGSQESKRGVGGAVRDENTILFSKKEQSLLLELKNFIDYRLTQINERLSDNSSAAISSADEILKFKKLLDDGVITQEEFDAKKKQLLGL